MKRGEKIEIVARLMNSGPETGPTTPPGYPEYVYFNHPIQEKIIGEFVHDNARTSGLIEEVSRIPGAASGIGLELSTIVTGLGTVIENSLNDYRNEWLKTHDISGLPINEEQGIGFDAVATGLDIAAIVAKTVHRELGPEASFETFKNAFLTSFQENIIDNGLTMIPAQAVSSAELLHALSLNDPLANVLQLKLLQSYGNEATGSYVLKYLNDILNSNNMSSQYKDSIREFLRESQNMTTSEIGDFVFILIETIYDPTGLIYSYPDQPPQAIVDKDFDNTYQLAGIHGINFPMIRELIKNVTGRVSNLVPVKLLRPEIFSVCPVTDERMVDREQLLKTNGRNGKPLTEQIAAHAQEVATSNADHTYGCVASYIIPRGSDAGEVPSIVTELAGYLPESRNRPSFIDIVNALFLKVIADNWETVQAQGMI